MCFSCFHSSSAKKPAPPQPALSDPQPSGHVIVPAAAVPRAGDTTQPSEPTAIPTAAKVPAAAAVTTASTAAVPDPQIHYASEAEALRALAKGIESDDHDTVMRLQRCWCTPDPASPNAGCAGHWVVAAGRLRLARMMVDVVQADLPTPDLNPFAVADARGATAVELAAEISRSEGGDSLSILATLLPAVGRQTLLQTRNFGAKDGVESSILGAAIRNADVGGLQLILDHIRSMHASAVDIRATGLSIADIAFGPNCIRHFVVSGKAYQEHARLVLAAIEFLYQPSSPDWLSVHLPTWISSGTCQLFGAATSLNSTRPRLLSLMIATSPSQTTPRGVLATLVESSLEVDALLACLDAISDSLCVSAAAMDPDCAAGHLTDLASAALAALAHPEATRILESLVRFPDAGLAVGEKLIQTSSAHATTVVHAVARAGQPQWMETVFRVATDDAAPVVDSDMLYPVHVAASQDNPQALSALLAKWSSTVNSAGPNGDTPMHFAMRSSHPLVISTLVQFGADPNLPNSAGQTPLHQARRAAHPENVHAVVLAGGRGDPRLPTTLQTPLHVALCSESVHDQPTIQLVAQLLHAPGASPRAQDAAGDTAMHLAVRLANVPIARYLAECAAAPGSPAGSGGPAEFPWPVNALGMNPAHELVLRATHAFPSSTQVNSAHVSVETAVAMVALFDRRTINSLWAGKTVLDLAEGSNTSLTDAIRERGGVSSAIVGMASLASAVAARSISRASSSVSARDVPVKLAALKATANDGAVAAGPKNPPSQVAPLVVSTKLLTAMNVEDPIAAYLSGGGSSRTPLVPNNIDDPIAAYLSGASSSPAPPVPAVEDPIAAYLSGASSSASTAQDAAPKPALVDEDPIAAYLAGSNGAAASASFGQSLPKADVAPDAIKKDPVADYTADAVATVIPPPSPQPYASADKSIAQEDQQPPPQQPTEVADDAEAPLAETIPLPEDDGESLLEEERAVEAQLAALLVDAQVPIITGSELVLGHDTPTETDSDDDVDTTSAAMASEMTPSQDVLALEIMMAGPSDADVVGDTELHDLAEEFDVAELFEGSTSAAAAPQVPTTVDDGADDDKHDDKCHDDKHDDEMDPESAHDDTDECDRPVAASSSPSSSKQHSLSDPQPLDASAATTKSEFETMGKLAVLDQEGEALLHEALGGGEKDGGVQPTETSASAGALLWDPEATDMTTSAELLARLEREERELMMDLETSEPLMDDDNGKDDDDNSDGDATSRSPSPHSMAHKQRKQHQHQPHEFKARPSTRTTAHGQHRHAAP
ncbi:hypothetical protein BC828DRAFT_371770 [Blastocladiella britannica]|nr:hypothetical protein BC828DRAFT_371770 [Blastocladiella britannica]